MSGLPRPTLLFRDCFPLPLLIDQLQHAISGEAVERVCPNSKYELVADAFHASPVASDMNECFYPAHVRVPDCPAAKTLTASRYFTSYQIGVPSISLSLQLTRQAPVCVAN